MPEFFTAANVTHAISVVHNGTGVTVYKDGAVTATGAMPALDYTDARAMVVGARKIDSECANFDIIYYLVWDRTISVFLSLKLRSL